MTQQNSGMVSATSSVARSMTEQAAHLTDVVSRFRTDANEVSHERPSSVERSAASESEAEELPAVA